MNQSEEDKKLLDSFGAPRDDIDRAYFQYCARNAGAGKIKTAVRNCFWYGLTAAAFIVYAFRSLRKSKSSECDALFLDVISREDGQFRYSGIFPEELKTEFPGMMTYTAAHYPGLRTGRLSKRVLSLWSTLIKRYPGAGKLICMSFFHLCSAEELLQIYRPKAVISYRLEYNIASSILTCFYESAGTELINFMHGDYLTDIKRAFVRYSRCYIFSEHYKKLFAWSGSPESQFVVYTPPMYKQQFPLLEHYPYYVTYYFSGEEGNIGELEKLMAHLVGQGHHCKVRSHPRFSDAELIRRSFKGLGVTIEDPREITIEESLAQTEYVVGRVSTVLTHGFFCGKKVIVDDITIPSVYEEMKDRMNIMASLPHERLSDFRERVYRENT